MSKLGYELYRGRLKKHLSRADGEGFAKLCWAVDSLQSGNAQRVAIAQRVIQHGPNAIVNSPASKHFIHKWMLETLFNELLLTQTHKKKEGGQKKLNHQHFDGIVLVYNALREMENSEYGLKCKPEHVRHEMTRILHRQFDWQKQKFNRIDLARSLELYSGALTQAYFEERRGISISTFILAGYAAYIILASAEGFTCPKSAPELGLTEGHFQTAMNAISLTLDQAKTEAASLRNGDQNLTAYKKSVLRLHPLIKCGAQPIYRAPLIELIWWRVTNGIFYDVVAAKGSVGNEISSRFEGYCTALLEHAFPQVNWQREEQYQFKGSKETPDIRAVSGGVTHLVVECKAHRMDIVARFGEDPLTEAPRGFVEVANGVRQVWRYVSHARQGAIPGAAVNEKTLGVVLTLDPWMRMAADRYEAILARAHELADAEGGIDQQDRRPVAIACIEDIEELCRKASLESFQAVLRQAAGSEYSGYIMSVLHDTLFDGGVGVEREYPFFDRLGDHLPWWQILEARTAERT